MSKKPRRSGNPANRPDAAGRRPRAEQPSGGFYDASRSVLVRLTALPPYVVPGTMIVLLLLGLLGPIPVAVVAFVVVLAFVGWLAVLSWPILDNRGRLMRGIVFGLVLAAFIARITGTL